MFSYYWKYKFIINAVLLLLMGIWMRTAGYPTHWEFIAAILNVLVFLYLIRRNKARTAASTNASS